MNTENGIVGFRERLAGLISDPEPFVWAKKVGIPSSTFDRIWNGGAIPKADTLLRIARHCGVTVDWLLTGEGDMHQGVEPAGATAAVDPDLVGRVLEAISAVYKEMGWGKTLAQLGAEAARIAEDIAAEGVSQDEQPAAVKAAAAMLRRQLRQAVADPTGETAGKLRG